MRENRGNVAGDEKFLFAEADHDRRAQARGDDLVRIFGRKGHQRVSAAHHLHRFQDRFFQRSVLRKFLEQMGDDFGVGFGEELVAFGDELLFQLDIVFDDAVVHDDDFAGAIAVRMGIFLGGAAVRGPARVADAVDAVERSDANRFFEIAQLARGAANFQLAVIADDGDSGRVVAAIFEAAQAVENQRHNALWADITDDSAHDGMLLGKLPGDDCDETGSSVYEASTRIGRGRSAEGACFAYGTVFKGLLES